MRMAKELALTRGFVTILDDDWHELLSMSAWSALVGKRGVYAVRNGGNGRHDYMHKLILDLRPGQIGDHIDGNTLNNRRDNLRIASAAENARNRKARLGTSSPFKGVSWIPGYDRWRASIYTGGRQTLLGHFDTEEAAAKAYDRAAHIHFGAFAKLNFEDESNGSSNRT